MNNVKSKLMKMMVPAVFGLIITFMFQLVDTYFIGKLGSEPLTAVGFTFPLYITIINLFIGLSIGIGATVGQAFGKKDQDAIKNYATLGLMLSLVMSVTIVLLAYSFRLQVYTLLGATANMSLLIDEYMSPLLLGMPFVLVAMNMIAALRGVGKGLLPEIVMAIGGILNLILDYILIFGMAGLPAMGIRGAAVATVISWSVVFITILVVMIKSKLLSLSMMNLKASLSNILRVSLPAMFNNLIMPVSIMVVTRVIANQSEISVAAYGIASKIESLLLAVIMALSMVLVPIMAQSYGADDQMEMDGIVVVSGKISIYWSALVYLIIIFFSKNIGAMFTQDPLVIDLISKYLLIVGLSYGLYSLTNVTIALFNAVDLPNKSLIITIIKYVLVLIPAVSLGGLYSMTGVIIALSITNLLGGILASRMFRKWLKAEGSELSDVNLASEYLKDIKNVIK